MSPEIAVLRALLRLARRRAPVTLDALVLRVDSDARAVRRALASLSRAGLVHTTPRGPQLTLSGFAVAVATTAAVPARRPEPRRPAPAAKPARVLPLVRRVRAA